MNGSPCNGWEHWCYQADDGGWHLIDELRHLAGMPVWPSLLKGMTMSEFLPLALGLAILITARK